MCIRDSIGTDWPEALGSRETQGWKDVRDFPTVGSPTKIYIREMISRFRLVFPFVSAGVGIHSGVASPRLPLKPVLTQGGETLHGGRCSQSKHRTEQYSSTASCTFSMLDIELFDVTSNFSTSHRTFRRDVEMFDVGHRKVGAERLPPDDPSLFSHFPF